MRNLPLLAIVALCLVVGSSVNDASAGTLVAPFVVDVHGFKARRWLLEEATLSRLSRLGVFTDPPRHAVQN